MLTDPLAVSRTKLLTTPFVLIVASGLAYFLGLAMLNPVLPVYIDGPLGGNGVQVGIGVGSFALGAVLLRPFAGRIGDRVGRRVLLLGGALIVSIATALYGVAEALWWLGSVRFVAGIGEAAFFVGAATMIADLAPESRRGEAMSYWSVAVYGGLAFGPFLGEIVLGPPGHEHFARAWMVSAGLALLAVAVGWFTREAEGFQASATAIKAPLFHRNAVGPGLVLFLGLVALAGWATFVKLYARDELGIAQARTIFLVYGAVILLIRVVGARLPDVLGAKVACTGALILGITGMMIIALWAAPAGLYVGTVVFAIGMSLLYPALLVMALDGVAPNERGSVIGTVSSFFDLSQGVGAGICGALKGVFGYSAVFWAGAGLAAAGLVVLYLLSDTSVAPEPPRGASLDAVQR